MMRRLLTALSLLALLGAALAVASHASAGGKGPPDTKTATGTPEPKETSTPELKDSDKDGLPDAEEKALGTNPAKQDTDGDHCGDYPEAHHELGKDVASDPTNPLDFHDVTGDSMVLIDDVVAEVDGYFTSAAKGDMTPILDRTGDGQVLIDDIAAPVQQYFESCAGL
jgi:hypothetical protein